MKKLLFLFIAMLFFSSLSWGQSLANYTYTTNTTGSLDAMVGATSFAGSGSITTGYNDDNPSGLANIGFTFYFMGTPYTQFSVNSNGQMRLGSTIVAGNASITASTPLIAPMAGDNSAGLAGDLDPISYVVTGTSPSRILKIQWKNFNIPYSSTASGGNMQVWLYEETGKIEMIYGTMTCNSATTRSTFLASSNTATTAGYITLSATPTFTLAAAAVANSFTLGNIANLYSATDGSRRVFTFNPPTSPLAPTWAATPFTAVTAGATTLNWNDLSSNELGFLIFRSTDGITYTNVATAAANATSYTVTGLTPSTLYYWKVAAYNEGTAAYTSVNTQSTTAPVTYTWAGGATASWAAAASWTPARNIPDATDMLVFNGGGGVIATAVPSQTIRSLTISGSTSVSLQAAATSTLTIASDGTAADELSVASGSGLAINGSTAALTLTYSGTGSTGTIAGFLEVLANGFANTVNLTGGTTPVTTVSGYLSLYQASGTVAPVITGSLATLVMTATANYNHNVVSVAGTIPTATWNIASTCNVIGYTTTKLVPSGLGQTFGNFKWNCTGQTVTDSLQLSSTTFNVAGTFSVLSTGTGDLRLASTGSYTMNVGNLVVSGGTLNLISGSSGTPSMNITGSLTQTAPGIILSTATSTGNPTLNFSGLTNQAISFATHPTGPITFRVSNPLGITLSEPNTNFVIGNGTLGGLRISTAFATPITLAGSLTAIQYNAANTTLTFDAPGITTASALIYPSVLGPLNLTVNTGAGSGVIIPFDRTISGTGTLTMTSGDIYMGTYTLTLGTGVAAMGTLLPATPGGNIIGNFKRWVAAAIASKEYPVGVPLSSRRATINYTVAPTTGGTLTAKFIATDPGTTGLPLTQGIINVNTVAKAGYWKIDAGDGLTGGTYTISLIAANIPGVNTYDSLVMLKRPTAGSWILDGTHVKTTGSNASATLSRSGITTGFSEFGIGGDVLRNPMGGANVFSVATGNWGDGATWSTGVVPGANDFVTISPATVVTTAGGTPPYVCFNLTVAALSTLNASSTLNIGGILTNAGTFNSTAGTTTVTAASTTGITNAAGTGFFTINGGTVTLGPNGGSNRTFANSGTMTVTTGTLNINGNFSNTSSTGNVFTQTGGDINVDGNAAGVAANSVASGTALVAFSTGTPTTLILSGGNITIVDPHTSASSYALSGGASTATNCSLGHTFIFGNGVSTDKAAGGFYVYLFPGASYLQLGNVIVNGAPGMDRFVLMNSTYGILGNLTINSGGDFRTSSSSNYFAGNITVNSNGTFTNINLVPVYLTSYANATTAAVTTPQTITGSGKFRDILPSATIGSGGTGYTVGDVLTVSGGTFTTPAKFVVNAVSAGVVTGVTAIGYANYSVAPTTPAATTGGTGFNCTLTPSGLTPAASLYSLTVNNTSAGGLTLGCPLSVSGTLTLTNGFVNTTATNLLTVGTASVSGGLSGGSKTAFVNGPLARTYGSSRTASGTYSTSTLYPVGKDGMYMPLWIDPTTTSSGAVIMTGEAFTTNSGTMGSGVTTLSPMRWEALVKTGIANLTNSYVRIGDSTMVTGQKILKSTTSAGSYGAIIPTTTFTAATPANTQNNPNTLTTASPILAADYTGYFSFGTLVVCSLPAAQPTALNSSLVTSTGLVGTFTASATASNYLVIRYAAGATPTLPVDYTLYSVGAAALGGTIVSISSATTFTQTGLTIGTPYTYYVYSYNNSACFGPIYLTSAPLTASFTTCAAAVGVPGTPVSSAITTGSFTAKWTSSTTPGVNYIIDVATDAAFTSLILSSYNNGIDTSYNVGGLSAATYYYLRVRAVDNSTTCYSNFSSTLTAMTLCYPIAAFPFTESFSANLGCWSAYEAVAGSSIHWTTVTAGTANGASAPKAGTHFAYINIYNALIANNPYYLESQSYALDATPKQLKYYYWLGASGYTTTPIPLSVQISTDGGATWPTTLYAHTSLNSTMSAWTLNSLDLTTYAGQTVKFRFVSNSNYGSGLTDQGIDEFLITNIVAPTVTTTKATAITGATAISGGNVTDNGGNTVSARGVCWSTSANPTILDPKTSNGTGSGIFVSNISGLTGSTVYHYRAYATNTVGTNYGGDSVMTTLNVYPPTVSMIGVTLVKDSTVTAHGNVTNDGGSGPILMNGFVWATTAAPLFNGVGVLQDTVLTPGLGVFSMGLTKLTPGTLYHINAYATNSVGTSYGTETTFTTVGITTTAATAIGSYNATSGGNISSDGGNAITVRGVCFDTVANPTILSMGYTTDGSGTGVFVSNLTLPYASKTYHIRAYATNAIGTFYGSDLNFKTLCDPGSITGTTPATLCGTGSVTVSATATTGVTMKWYSALTGGLNLATGGSLTTTVSADTNFYVAATQGETSSYVGAPNTGISASMSGQSTTATGIIFSVLAPTVKINSIDMYPTTTIGTSFTIVVTSGSTTIASYTGLTTVTGTTTTPVVQTVPVNFEIPTGTAYLMSFTSNPLTIRNSGGDAFPYTIPGVISLTSASLSGYYYYLYNWNVTVGCSGSRTPVHVTVTAPPALSISGNHQTVCNNVPSTALSVTSTIGDFDAYVWTPATGLFTDASAATPYVAGASATTVYVKTATAGQLIYTCTASNAALCSNIVRDTLMVREGTVINITASQNPICASSPTILTGIFGTAGGTQNYTAPPAVSSPTSDEDLGNITFGSLNNTTLVNSLVGTIGTATGTVGSYSNFTAFGPYNFTAGSTYTLSLSSVTSAGPYSNAFGVYIDYNRNGVFTDAGEAVYLSTVTVSGVHTETASVTIPLTASGGVTRMRVISNEGLVTSPTQAVYYGEYEEYSLNIQNFGAGNTFVWDDGNAIVGSTNPITVSPAVNSTFTLTATDPNGCSKTASIDVIISNGITMNVQPSPVTKCAGKIATFTVDATGSGLTYQWRKNGVEISQLDNPSAITNTLVLDTVSLFTAGSYDVSITSLCGGLPLISSAVALTVNPLPTAVATSNSAICAGSTLNLTGTTNIGTSYSWTGPNSFTSISQNPSIPSASLTAGGIYRFTATSIDGCASLIGSTVVVVNPIPTTLSIGPDAAPTVNYGVSQQLTVSGGLVNATILSENFNGAVTGWSVINGSTGGSTPATGNFLLYLPSPTFKSNDSSIFAMANSDGQGSGGTTLTALISPSFSTSGYTSLTLSFWQYYQIYSTDVAVKVEVSLDGGSSWETTPLADYIGVTQGTATAFSNAVIDMSAYINKPNVKIRFYYESAWGYNWAIDNVSITASGTATTTWSPVSGLFIDAAGLTPYTVGNATTVYARPDATSSYTATATTSTGCTNSANVLVTVICPVPTALNTISLGTDNAKIGWTSTSGDFDLEYGVAPYTFTGTPTKTGIGANSYTITGLAASTTYQYKVKANCSVASVSLWSVMGTFTTDANAIPGLWTGANSTDWLVSGNWSDLTVPTAAVNVEIPSAPVNQPHITSAFTTPAACNNLLIHSGAVLTIDALKALTVNGIVTNSGGTSGLVIKSTAAGTGSLIHATASVNATVERYIPHTNTEEFHMLASPITSQAIAPFYLLDGFYTWNELSGLWTSYDDPNFASVNGGLNFVPGKGYAVSYPAAITKTFAGTLNQGALNIPLSFTSGNFEGWNFVGNPYPSSINWDAASGWSRTDLADAGGSENAMWIWNAGLANYGTYISNAGVGTGTNDVNADIALGQGFWVYAINTGTLGMTNDVRSHSSQSFMKSASTSDMIRLSVSGTANTYGDEIIVKFGNSNDQGGAQKMFSIDATSPSLYSSKLNKNWSINYLSTVAQNAIVPIGFKAGVNANYTIKASNLSSFSTPTYVYLKDLATNTITDLNQNSNYTFAANNTDNANRFQLLFALSPLSISNNATLNTSIYSNNNSIYINSNESIKSIAIYNTLGQLIKTVANTSGTITVNMKDNAMGYYIVKVVTTKNVYSEKVLVK
ncbi:MAG: GEVED domain-containing protein [Bacteroidales bacterium]